MQQRERNHINNCLISWVNWWWQSSKVRISVAVFWMFCVELIFIGNGVFLIFIRNRCWLLFPLAKECYLISDIGQPYFCTTFEKVSVGAHLFYFLILLAKKYGDSASIVNKSTKSFTIDGYGFIHSWWTKFNPSDVVRNQFSLTHETSPTTQPYEGWADPWNRVGHEQSAFPWKQQMSIKGTSQKGNGMIQVSRSRRSTPQQRSKSSTAVIGQSANTAASQLSINIPVLKFPNIPKPLLQKGC
jgi:hypothetical protein